MSILLDSLRKSEAQRNIGEAPSIYSTQEYGSSGAPRSQWAIWLLLGLTAAAIVWFGWRQYADPDIAGTTVPPGTEQADTGTTAQSDSGPATGADSGAEPRTPVERLAQSDRQDRSSSDSSLTPTENSSGSPADRIAAFEAQVGEAEEAEPMEDVIDEQELMEMLEQAEAGPSSGTEIVDEVVDDDSIAQTEPTASRRSRVDPPDSEPLSYWQLPQGLRNDMPEFKITVLVYAEAPEDRFVLINGERLQEQEELEGGVLLEEIRRDGAVFSYRTYRFLVKG
jgi:general secretion pathway protein B